LNKHTMQTDFALVP